jgi:hypothetical protein
MPDPVGKLRRRVRPDDVQNVVVVQFEDLGDQALTDAVGLADQGIDSYFHHILLASSSRANIPNLILLGHEVRVPTGTRK